MQGEKQGGTETEKWAGKETKSEDGIESQKWEGKRKIEMRKIEVNVKK